MIARFLIDTSAAARMRLAAVADRLEPLITAGLVATCAVLDAEALYGARSAAEYERVWTGRWSRQPYTSDRWEMRTTRTGTWSSWMAKMTRY